MRKGIWASPWFRHIAAACCYGILIALSRYQLISHWVPSSGIRLTALLIAPYRYWPALIVGEMPSLAYLSYACAGDYGLLWALANLVPGSLLMAPIVYWAREKGRLFKSVAELDMGVLLAISLVFSLLITAYNCYMMSITRLPLSYGPIHYNTLAAHWMLGNYIGILTITPTMLFIYQRVREAGWRALFREINESRLLFDVACFAIPMLALLVWIGATNPSVRQVAQLTMFCPVIWLALRHGWHGAAIGGTAASVAIVLLMPERYDHDTLQAEVLVAFVVSTLLLAGNRIGALDRRAENDRRDVRMALSLAQRNMHIGEMQLRMASQALEQIRETLQSTNAGMLGRLQLLLPTADDGNYRREALQTYDQLYRLSDNLYPISWRERSLPTALRDGAVAQMLAESGVHFRSDIRGPLSRMSNSLHLVVYRMICEAIAYGCAGKDVSDIDVRIRCGSKSGRPWMAASVRMETHSLRAAEVCWEELLPRIARATSGLGLSAIKDRAKTYEGDADERISGNSRSISFLVLEPA